MRRVDDLRASDVVLGLRMIQLGDDPGGELLAFARTWCAFVANDEWDAALGMLDEPNRYGIAWTAESVLALVNETFDVDTVFARKFGPPKFSAVESARGRERFYFGRTRDGFYWLDYDVPLNGHFSDLTVQFEFHPRAGGFAAMLHDLHVL